MTKQPSDYPTVSYRPDEAQYLRLVKHSNEQHSLNQTAKRDLGRLYDLYDLVLPVFSLDEALVLVETLHDEIDFETQKVHKLPALVRASRNVVDEELDAEFLQRLDKMHVCEYMAILNAVESFWLSDSSQSVEARLQEAGLIRQDSLET